MTVPQGIVGPGGRLRLGPKPRPQYCGQCKSRDMTMLPSRSAQRRFLSLESVDCPDTGSLGQARLEKIDLRTDEEDVAEPDWVLQPVAIGPATARTADI
jgi:hypothetical protein